jgi:hypothetical protein
VELPEGALAGFESDASPEPTGAAAPSRAKATALGSVIGLLVGTEEPVGALAGFEPASRTYRLTVPRWMPSSRAIRRLDQPCP